MSNAQLIDMSKLPAPDVVQVPDFEVILADLKADLIAAYPAAADVLALESEPLTKLVERWAYQLVVERSARNDSAHAVMLAYAKGADLDQLGAFFGVVRLVVTAGDANAYPAVAEVLEDDDSFRERIQLAPRGYSVAGPVGAYVYHAKSADGQVLDAAATSPAPGHVMVSVLSRTGDGTPDAALLAKVLAAVNADDIRPLTDYVQVQGAGIVPYTIAATVYTLPGPDSATVLAAIDTRIRAYATAMHRIGRRPTLSGIYAALHIEGVAGVNLASPAADVPVGDTQAAYCTAIQVTYGGTVD